MYVYAIEIISSKDIIRCKHDIILFLKSQIIVKFSIEPHKGIDLPEKVMA